MIYNTNIDLLNDNVYTKFGLNRSIRFLVNDNVFTKFGLILSIRSQDIEQKPNSDVNQGPYLCCKFAKNNDLQYQHRSSQ